MMVDRYLFYYVCCSLVCFLSGFLRYVLCLWRGVLREGGNFFLFVFYGFFRILMVYKGLVVVVFCYFVEESSLVLVFFMERGEKVIV